MNLEADLRAELLAYLPVPDRDVAAWLQSMQTPRLLECFLTLRGRLIHPHARALRVSAELASQAHGTSLHAETSAIWRKITDGADLTPHLSRKIGFTYLQEFRRARDIDILVSEWNIHPLHLSGNAGPHGYTERGNQLLFVMARDDAIYCLDIFPRAGWRLQRLAEIAHRNWPDQGLLHKLPGAAAPPRPSGGGKSRHAGLPCQIAVDGETFVANSYGLNTGAKPAQVTVAAMRLLGLLHYYTENPALLERDLRTANARFGVDWPLIPQWRLVLAKTARAWEFVVREERTTLMMSLESEKGSVLF